MSFPTFRSCLEKSLDVMATQEAVFREVAELVAITQREVIVTAIGKSGYVAQKFAASLRSIGIPSYFLHAAEAGHGDIGNVVQNQIVFAISKSGSSSEIKVLLPDLKARDCILVAITNRNASPLANAAHHIICTGTENEGSIVDDVPLVSTEAALFACDYIIASVIESRKLTKDNFLYNHPAGQIGANLKYSVADFVDMSKRTEICVSLDATAMDALLTTTRGRVGAVCVVNDEKKICGYLTDGDFRRLAGRGVDLTTTPVKDVMNENPKVIKAAMLIGNVLDIFERSTPPIASAPVASDTDTFLGIVSIHDLIGPR